MLLTQREIRRKAEEIVKNQLKSVIPDLEDLDALPGDAREDAKDVVYNLSALLAQAQNISINGAIGEKH